MLWTIIVVLLVLWLLGAFVRPVGGFVHLLLVIVLILVIIQLLQ
ncbi:MAG TPA: lmo0937 family membrane protein [Gemmatimonadota bacterium]|nr:lmo0937 family membrane protein [Gemmatimonadota bacterium]